MPEPALEGALCPIGVATLEDGTLLVTDLPARVTLAGPSSIQGMGSLRRFEAGWHR